MLPGMLVSRLLKHCEIVGKEMKRREFFEFASELITLISKFFK